MPDLNLKSMTGTVDYYRISNTDEWTELPEIAETLGGAIINKVLEYIDHKSGIRSKITTVQGYEDVIIKVAKDVGDSPYTSNTVTILNDLANNKTIFELVKNVPINQNQYESTVFKGYVSKALTDEAKADEIQKGDFVLSVSSRNEYIGSLDNNNKLVLTARV